MSSIKTKPYSVRDAKFAFMGKQESGDYMYYGFKEIFGPQFYIMRKDLTNDAAWSHHFGDGGATPFETVWADPTGLDYGTPEDSR